MSSALVRTEKALAATEGKLDATKDKLKEANAKYATASRRAHSLANKLLGHEKRREGELASQAADDAAAAKQLADFRHMYEALLSMNAALEEGAD